MGLRKEYIAWFMYIFIKIVGYERLGELRMCELGNQEIRKSASDYFNANGIHRFKTGKEYFTHLGFRHTSIDLNGQDGALSIDLAKPILDGNLIGLFDIITNAGTTEHVSNQFECFKNIHNLCKEGGIFLHLVPPTNYDEIRRSKGRYVGRHGYYNYDFEFFTQLASLCSYDILDNRIIRDLICIAMRKNRDNSFISKTPFETVKRYLRQ
jgi:hypothetical protein